MANTVDFESALAISRFGLGCTPAGLDALPARGRDLIFHEIDHGRVAMPGQGRLPSSAKLLAELQHMHNRNLELAKGSTSERVPSPVGPHFQAEIDARFNGPLRDAPVGFGERLVMFWMNHFAVSIDKGSSVRISAGAYEREAIRPFVFGRFTDMLVAVETHPCMLYYLDNVTSTGPNSRAGRRDDKGLNENLAREIFELHTLGVDGGYSQADVTAFAKALTGWTAARNPAFDDEPLGSFTFRASTHEPGSQVILGHRYGDSGFFQAGDVMVDLAKHPATARHISTKLVRHFVADDPSPALVQRLADRWVSTGGDLSSVYQELIGADEAWAPQPAKLCTPQVFLVAAMRATGTPLTPPMVDKMTKALGQPLWQPSGPNGFPDITAAWLTPEGLNARMQVASALAEKVPQGADPRAFAETMLGPRLSDTTRVTIARADTVPQGISLALLSPEFMRC
ncbi:MAG: DUF1800 family protein [Asticcacaulis sp.]|nr:DUF1800 family protein [Asticcacaulis sp.]